MVYIRPRSQEKYDTLPRVKLHFDLVHLQEASKGTSQVYGAVAGELKAKLLGASLELKACIYIYIYIKRSKNKNKGEKENETDQKPCKRVRFDHSPSMEASTALGQAISLFL